jgi:hypothetical protein
MIGTTSSCISDRLRYIYSICRYFRTVCIVWIPDPIVSCMERKGVRSLEPLSWSRCLFACLMVFNATFNNISVISWSVLLLEETKGHRENPRPVASHWQFYHIMLYTLSWSRFELTTPMVRGTDCIGSCKSNDHTITAFLFIYELPLEIQLLRGEGWDQVNWFIPTKCLWLSQTRTWICNIICRGLFHVISFEVINGCSFCWYW